jgi:hypothetical protein
MTVKKNSGFCIDCGKPKKTTYGPRCPSCAAKIKRTVFCIDCGKLLRGVSPHKKRCAKCSAVRIRNYSILWRKNNLDKMKLY